MKQIRLLFICVLILSSAIANAQVVNKDVYKAEIGLLGGGSFYIGDANSQLFNNIQLAYGGFFRYILNNRYAFRAELTRTYVLGNDLNSGDICAEFNFFDLEKNPYKRFSKIYSPYIFTGIGFMTGVYKNQQVPDLSLPFGVGMKVKLSERLNLNAQWSSRLLLFSDNMEDNILYNNPFGLNGKNIFNNDLLSTFTVGISYDIWKKKCDCLNTNAKKH